METFTLVGPTPMCHRPAFFILLLAALLSLGAGSAAAQVVSIDGLYTTGVKNNGNLLKSNRQDSHYVVTDSSAGSTYTGSAYTVTTPASGWMAEPSDAQWIIAPNGAKNGKDTTRPAATYDYTLTFDMPAGAQLSSVSITGTGAADDTATIYVNGTLVSGQTLSSWSSANSFALNSGNAAFVSGANSITFRVNNSGGGATGLMITGFSGTAVVPEVGAFLPVATAVTLCGLGLIRRRRRGSTAVNAPR